MSNEGGRNPITLEHHFARVVEVGAWCCWRLPNALSRGYCYIQFARTRGQAHVIFYKHLIGPIPRGLTLDHLCRNRWCCNPNHIAPVTRGVNVLRGSGPIACNARKQRCPRGHVYDRVVNDKHRRCRKCDAAAARRAYRKRKNHVDG